MPVVMKLNENGMVDAVGKTVRLPSYLGPKPDWKNDVVRKAAIASVPLLMLSASSMPAMATPVTLSDGGDTAIIDPTTSAGLESLIVSGSQQVQQQWFYYRDTATGAMSSIDTISAPAINQFSASGVTLTYSNADLSIQITYNLTSEPSNSAELPEDIVVTNNQSTGTLPIDIVQFNHFTLDNDNTHDQVSITNGNTAMQTLTTGPTTSYESDVTRVPDFYDAGLSPTILNEITGAGFTNLADNASSGPGDVTYAFQWNENVAAGLGDDISKNREISNVPEPTSMVASLIGGVAIYFGRRPRRRDRSVTPTTK